MNRQAYHANGKLLLTGEYFILDGAVGLALPTKFGQSLTVEVKGENGISWISLDNENKIWFEAQFSISLEIISTSNNEIANTLQQILSHCNLTTHNSQLTTQLEFPQNWGLGSSSTLISLIAQWTNTNPYELLEKIFGGSGYDIACATTKQPIIYERRHSERSGESRIIKEVSFSPSFSNHLYFLHLNQKQNSREGIQHYKNLNIDKTTYIKHISELTQKIIQAKSLDEFCAYLEEHENIVSNVLHLPKVKDRLFPDFPGTVKSLGAWGGDFVLVAGKEQQEFIQNYFSEKDYSTLLRYEEIIL